MDLCVPTVAPVAGMMTTTPVLMTMMVLVMPMLLLVVAMVIMTVMFALVTRLHRGGDKQADNTWTNECLQVQLLAPLLLGLQSASGALNRH